MNHTYHNCLLESSHLENPSVLTGVAVGDWDGQYLMHVLFYMSFSERIIHILKSLSKLLVK